MLCTAIGIGVGRYAESCYDDRLAERDAVFRHYIELHPEDFPMPGMAFFFVLTYVLNAFFFRTEKMVRGAAAMEPDSLIRSRGRIRSTSDKICKYNKN